MKRNLRIFLLFAIFSIKTSFHHPLGITLFLLGKLIRFGMFFMFVWYLLSRTRLLAGYTSEQTIIFYLTYNIIDSLTQLLFREVYRFRPLVVSGELDSLLVKPYHPFMRILVGGIDVLDLGITLVYGAIAGYIIAGIHGIASGNIIVYLFCMVCSVVIATGFHIMVLALGILSTEVDHTIMIYRDISKMGTFPIDIYQQPLRFIFTFVIPVGIMMSAPVQGLFGTHFSQIVLTSGVAAALSLTASLWLWGYAIKKYQSWGG